jgi:RHS repeat-associated protein
VIPEYYSYGVNGDGSTWSKVSVSAPSSPHYIITTSDPLGRTLSTAQPGFTGVEISTSTYDDRGRLVRRQSPGRAVTQYRYDDLGNQIAAGLDIDGNMLLEEGSTDQLVTSDISYVFIDGQWWRQSAQWTYRTAGSPAATALGGSRQQLTGLGEAGVVSRTVNTDIHGNQTTTWETIDRAAKTRTSYTDFVDSTTDARTITVNGLLRSQRDQTGIELIYGYDDLGRQTTLTDPRTGAATTHYNGNGQVDYVEDAAGHRTNYGYDGSSGLRVLSINADGKRTRYRYNQRNQLTHVWGDGSYPIRYEYDDYGRRAKMHTYRGGSDWGQPIWPEGTTGTADTTTFHFHEPSGLLIGKEDADGHRVDYTYHPGGTMASRTWARNGGSLVTGYSYDPGTMELIAIDYSDATPDIGFGYTRAGQLATVSDALGSRSFGYNEYLQPTTETITGALYDAAIVRSYDPTGVPGRATGLSLDGDYQLSYGYDGYGRFSSVDWQQGGRSGSVAYGYVADSHLLESITATGGTTTITNYGYEPHRDLKTSVANLAGAALVSSYTYTYDSLGRRQNVANTGSAFAGPAFSIYGYNARNELTDSGRYQGTDATDLSVPVADEHRAYIYDSIGNRLTAESGLGAGRERIDYESNALNQYELITGGALTNPSYDEDGNLTGYDKAGTRVQLVFNGENRPRVIAPVTPAPGAMKAEFVYDYLGRRVQKRILSWNGSNYQPTAIGLFIYDGWNLLEERDESGASRSHYVYGLDLSGTLQGAGSIGGLVAGIDHGLGVVHHYFYDASGNVVQLVDGSDGSVAASYEYDAYGTIVSSSGSFAGSNPFRFSTKYLDSETGLYYYGYRYYSPELGRWVSRDPLEEDGGINLYGFINNDPVNFLDALGLLSRSETRRNWNMKYGSRASRAVEYSLVNRALEAVLKSAFYRCYLLDLSDEQLEEINVSIEHDLSLIDTSYVQGVLRNAPKSAALKFLALNHAARKITALIPQGTPGFLGISTPQSFAAQKLNKKRMLVKLRKEIRNHSIRIVGRGGVKVWGRLGSKALPIVGWFSLGYEIVKVCHCENVTKDGDFTNDEKMLGQ